MEKPTIKPRRGRGQPALPEDERKVVIGLRIEPKLFAEIEEAAAAWNVSLSAAALRWLLIGQKTERTEGVMSSRVAGIISQMERLNMGNRIKADAILEMLEREIKGLLAQQG